MQADTILSVEALQITFAGPNPFTAVSNISFSIAKGKTLAIVGESGSGKSLTALALMGLLPNTASVRGALTLQLPAENPRLPLRSINLTPNELIRVRGKDISMVFQEPMSSLNPVMFVGKQLKEAILTHQPLTNSAGKQLTIDWLAKVQLPYPEKMYDRYPHQLSGGQKQRVMIAIAMCNHPALLIADEPTTALDVTVQAEVIRLMAYLRQEHQSAMIFITHDLSLAATIADDVLVMYKGQMVEYGPVSKVLTTPDSAYTKALLACKPSADKKGAPLPVVADYMGEKESAISVVTPHPQIDSDPGALPLITVNNLRVWFTEKTSLLGNPTSYFKAVDDVSFTINKGEVLGLVGESGCGKSTLSRALIGLIPVHSGNIMYNRHDLATLPLRDWTLVRKDIQMIFQDPYSSLNPRMTIGDMLREPLMVHNMVPKNQLEAEAKRLLSLVQLPADALHRYPHQFSGGQRQRVGIARALALRPRLLICDESVSALDVSIQAQILNLLKDLQQEFQLTYLFISHDLSVVHYISDRVMVMQAGKIVENGTAQQVLKAPQNEYTKRLVAAMP
jgi:peptide/nickel transport system ATP-binding protein